MKICFFCKIADRKNLFFVEFYHQDINILKKIDPQMTVATRYSEIDWNADVIFVWWWTYAFFPILTSKILNKKVFITGTFNYRCPEANSDYFRRPFWQRMLIKFSLKYATRNIFVSKNEYEQISSDWKYSNMEYSPHCIDTAKYSASLIRDKANDLFTICWTGKENIKRKCLIEIIDAIDLLRQKNKEIHLNIAGHEGEAFSFVKEYIRSKKLDSNISLLGRISEEEKINYLQNCSCYLQPSKYEGFGLAMAEAMSCGAIIISTPVGEVANVVGDAGILIENASSENIAIAVNTILSSDMKRLAAKARERICTLFPMSRRESDLISIINKYAK